MSYQIQEINRRIQADPKEFVDACDAAYAEKIERAARAIAENVRTCPIVLLSGPSGSGKTTTAMKIAEALCTLGVGSQSLAMDDYFRTVDLRTAPRTPEGDLDLESPACLDMDLLGKHLNALARGEEIHLPRYNFVTRVQSGPIGRPMRLGKDEVVVCEGIHALNDEIAAYCPDAFRLYISARSVVVDDDGTEVFKGTEFKPFAAVLEAGGTIRAINAKGLADKLSRKNIDKLGEVAKTYGAKGLAYSRLTADGTSSSFEKFLTDAEKAALYAALNAETGDVLLLVSDTDWVKACTALGQVRLDIARKHGLIDPDKFNFLWVVDFPLFEYSEQEGRWMAMHHPFTLPKAEDLDKVESDPGACHAVAYDIVLNGVEMGGGSMRINDPALQDRMFHALGFTEEKARESFGFLMDAYKFGAPPHGGMAYGLDRMVMLMLKKDSIRDVIAFPKVQNAGEPMSGAPDVVDEQQLKDLSIALTLKD